MWCLLSLAFPLLASAQEEVDVAVPYDFESGTWLFDAEGKITDTAVEMVQNVKALDVSTVKGYRALANIVRRLTNKKEFSESQMIMIMAARREQFEKISDTERGMKAGAFTDDMKVLKEAPVKRNLQEAEMAGKNYFEESFTIEEKTIKELFVKYSIVTIL